MVLHLAALVEERVKEACQQLSQDSQVLVESKSGGDSENWGPGARN